MAAGSLFLLCLTASSYHCRHEHADDVRRRVSHLLGVTKQSSSSSYSEPRREDRIKSSLSAQSAGIEEQIDSLQILRLDARQMRWEEKYLQLKRFKEREGHFKVPARRTKDEANLRTWANNQRQLKRKGKLNRDRQRILEGIGFEWTRRKPAQLAWDDWFALLQQFKKREGHCKVHAQHTEDGAKLGQWVPNQRQLKTKGKLSPDRQKILEEIGFEWVLTSATWDEMYALLEQFEKRVGHCNVSQFHKEDRARLGSWVARQRHLKKTAKLDPDRQELLDKIGLEWMWTSESWDEWFVLLQQFKKREGHCNVHAQRLENGEYLGSWVSAQRQLKKKGKLDPDREKRLGEIGFEWARYAKNERIPHTSKPSIP